MTLNPRNNLLVVFCILRFFRFHAHFGKGDPDPAAAAAARGAAKLVPGLSGERVWAELARILDAVVPAAALALMDSVGVLAPVLPDHLGGGDGIARLAALAGIEAAEGLAADGCAVLTLHKDDTPTCKNKHR